jgi:transcriptional regulator of acetoin/glycerol metabolism
MSNQQLSPLSNPRNDRTIMSAWNDFLTGHVPPANALRCLIDDSWRRCLDVKVDPSRVQAQAPLDEQALDTLQQQHRELLDAGQQVMAMARDLLAETETIMILTDPNGMILSVEGDPRALGAAEVIRLSMGSSWNELICGTNAIGTALSIGQPVQIHASEHFCAGIKDWTCSATVIRDPYDGKILGAIDVSGLGKTFSPHCLALAVTTAGRIESQLARQEMDFRYQLLERSMARMSSMQDGVIICDRRGYPIKANERAAAALQARGIDVDLNGSSAIATLNLGVFSSNPGAPAPAWLRGDWLEPILVAGERIGTLLTIPALPTRPTGRKVAAVQDDSDDKSDGKSDNEGFAAIIGTSAPLLQAVSKARLLARTNVPVLLQGETGVGKENFSRGIHNAGNRAGNRTANRAGHLSEQPSEHLFVALNCGGLSKDLLASELFGHAEGAFTGSRRGGMAGKIEAADGGTLFLDEIGEMPLELQPHFLRVLEEGEIYRIGETVPRKIHFKLISATNRDLREEVAQGRFRMDLFYRVSVTSIRIPPLRERRGDIAALVAHFLHQFTKRYAMAAKDMAPEVLAALEQHPWPGNVRELRNAVESMFLMAGSAPSLQLDALPDEIASSSSMSPCLAPLGAPRGDLEGVELASIRATLAADRGNLTQAARHLGIAKSTLYAKLKKYGLDQDVDGARSAPH